jgi:hypothetical protein
MYAGKRYTCKKLVLTHFLTLLIFKKKRYKKKILEKVYETSKIFLKKYFSVG